MDNSDLIDSIVQYCNNLFYSNFKGFIHHIDSNNHDVTYLVVTWVHGTPSDYTTKFSAFYTQIVDDSVSVDSNIKNARKNIADLFNKLAAIEVKESGRTAREMLHITPDQINF